MYGATQEEWDALITLCGADIRPTVCNPRLTDKNGDQIGWSMSKRASQVYASGTPGGIYGWQKMDASEDDIKAWRSNDNHGIGMVGRTIHGIDIDIDDRSMADAVEQAVVEIAGFLPARIRPNSGRRMLLFKTEQPLQKMKLTTEDGIIEILGTKQFIALAGMHKSGKRYEFREGIPIMGDIPVIDIDEVCEMLVDEFEAGLEESSTLDGVERDPDDVADDNQANAFVRNSKYFRHEMPDGSWAVVCPWHELHESTNGEAQDPNPSSTVYFPAGLGKREQPGFKCMHSSHGEKTIASFLNEIGFTETFFEVDEEEDEQEELKVIRRSPKTGFFPGLATNLISCLRWGPFPYKIRTDRFIHQIRNGDRAMEDADYGRIMEAIENLGCLSVSKTTLRDAITTKADMDSFDSGIDWIKSLQWDGIDRLEDFGPMVLGTDNSAYIRAVVRYLFTALAGRCLKPGTKADMVPVLYGRQGCRKSTFVEALAPLEGTGGMVSFDQTDADTSRLTRGKLVVEIAELRGLRSSDEEGIKAWITKAVDEWVPKYKEMPVQSPRRFVAIGTTNERRFLGDPTGNRRWLPVEVCQFKDHIDTEFVKTNVHQLWAQGKYIFEKEGVAWQEAESLAHDVTPQFRRRSAEADRIAKFLIRSPGEYSTFGLLEAEFGVNRRDATQMMTKIRVAMQMLGYVENGDDIWRLPFLD